MSVLIQQRELTPFAGCSNLRRPPVKPYSSSYTELLLLREPQLVLGLQRMYHQLVETSAWNGPRLPLVDGQPLTHDILSALNVLDPESGSMSDTEMFDAVSENATIRSTAADSNLIGSKTRNQDHMFNEWPTRSNDGAQPTPLRKASNTNTVSSCESSSASEPMSAISSSSRYNPGRALRTPPAEPTPLRNPSEDTNTTTSSYESSASSESMNMTPSSYYDPQWAVTRPSPAEPPFQARASSTANPELTDSDSPLDQTMSCFRTLDDPMFATLNQQQTYPVFRTMDDPMFATLVDGPWEYPSSLVRVNAGFAVA